MVKKLIQAGDGILGFKVKRSYFLFLFFLKRTTENFRKSEQFTKTLIFNEIDFHYFVYDLETY